MNIRSFDQKLGKLLRALSVLSLSALFVLLIGNVFFRFVPIFSFGWFDEIVELMFAYFVFYGAAALWREKEHFQVYFIPSKLKGKWRKAIDTMIDVINIAFLSMLFYYGLDLTIRAADWTPIFKLPKRIWYSCIPISSLLMLIYSTFSLYSRFKKEA